MVLVSRFGIRMTAIRGVRAMATLPDIDSSSLQIQRVQSPGTLPPLNTLKFGEKFSDHMLEVQWNANKGWSAPLISPYHNLPMDPSTNCLHYGIQCFEGMKAYKDARGRVRLFRPDMNMKRLHRSGERLSLPAFNKEEFLECLKQLVLADKDFIPNEDGYSLYLRPTFIGNTAALGVGPSFDATLFAICSPVGPYFASGFAPVKILAESHFHRAWPGGTGDAKVGGNYGPTILPQIAAAKRGFAQVLWLYGEEENVTEVGTMNQFFFLRNKEGDDELVTAPLDGTILPGVTRDSILALCREWGEFKVSERHYSIHEIVEALKEGRVHESFGAGTACVVAPINGLQFRDEYFDIPLDKEDPNAKAGKLAHRLWKTLLDIQYGRIEHPWSVILD